MKARYYIWGALGGLAVTAAPGSAWWIVPGLGLAAHMVIDERPEFLRQALPYVAQARAALPAVAWQLPRVKAETRPHRPDQERVSASPTSPVPGAGAELFDALEGPPHRLIIGHTRGGKTTLIHHMATAWARRGERVLVADPDAAPGLWPGCEVRGYGDDVPAIGELLAIVGAEVEARRLARAQGVRRFEPLHLVIDEAQDVLPVLPGGLDLFETVARRGGKLNVRMTIGVQDKQVKTLGIEGKSEVLRNLQMADVLKNRQGQRVAVLRDPETGKKVSLPIPELTDPETLITPRSATGTTENLRQPAPAGGAATSAGQAPIDLSDLLADLLAEPVPGAPGRARDAQGDAEVSLRPYVPTDGQGRRDTRSGTLVLPRDGGNLHLHLHASAEAHAPAAGPARPAGTWRRQGPAVRRRKPAQAPQERAEELHRAYQEAGAAGRAYRAVYRELGGSKDTTLAAWQAGRKQRRSAA